jgi:hypothetical protein
MPEPFDDEGGPQEIEVQFPPAPPALYLRWVAFLRTLEAVMHDHPPLAELARHESGVSFTEGEAASFVAGSVIPSIRRQAFQAITSQRATVAPMLATSRDVLAGWLDWTERQGAWLGLFGDDGAQRLRALGLTAMDGDLQDLVRRLTAVMAAAVTGPSD